VTRNSLDDLNIQEGTEVYALLKASSVIVVPGASPLRLSASNQLRGTIVNCRKGAVSAEVILRLAGGQTVTAVITNESIDRLELKEGDQAVAVFKSSSVILGVNA
jgi:molybdate transport system regulatory protein